MTVTPPCPARKVLNKEPSILAGTEGCVNPDCFTINSIWGVKARPTEGARAGTGERKTMEGKEEEDGG